jgi:hypothetical protein
MFINGYTKYKVARTFFSICTYCYVDKLFNIRNCSIYIRISLVHKSCISQYVRVLFNLIC